MSQPQFSARIIPEDFRFETLFANYDLYSYFHAAEHFSFQPQTPGLVNYWWLSEFSLLVYAEQPFIESTLIRLSTVDTILVEAGGLRALAIVFDTHIVVSFRGTLVELKENILTDIKCLLINYGRRGLVHQGFLQGFKLLWPTLYRRLRPHLGTRPAWFCGHSLGGALATLAFERIQNNAFLVTFGTPRVGNRQFCERLHRPAYRIVNNNDFVPHVPPPGLYRHHTGELIYIDSKGQLLFQPNLWRQIKEAVAGGSEHVTRWWKTNSPTSQILWDGLVDHSPFHYCLHLWNAMACGHKQ